MENKRSSDAIQSIESLSNQQGNVLAPATTQEPFTLEQTVQPANQPEYIVLNQKSKLGARLRLFLLMPTCLLLLGGGIYSLLHQNSRTSQVQAGNFGVVHIPLSSLSRSRSSTGTAQRLKVDGRLEVTNSIVLTPTNKPGIPITGQLYYDKTTNQLAYYNGQQFVNLGGQTADTTNVTNVTNNTSTSSSTTPTVQLQSASPGVQQTGNLNISGVAQVGTLKTAVIDSGGNTLFINPIGNVSLGPTPPGTPRELGLTTIGATNTTSNLNGYIFSTKATMPAASGIATSITVYIGGGSSSKHIQVGIYDDDGNFPSRPSSLLAVSLSTNLIPDAFNTITIPSVALSSNSTYWLAFNTDDPTITRPFDGGGNASCFYGLSFGFMPDPFGGFCFFANENYTIYANYTTSGGVGGSSGQALLTMGPTGQTLLRNSEDSISAFQIQDAPGINTIFNVDTLNGRIAIGKASAAYKLDIAGGDINLSSGRSLRFGGLPVVSVTSSGANTILSNFSTGGNVITESDNFIVQDGAGAHESLRINNTGSATFSNRVDSTQAFQIQNSVGTPLLKADSIGMKISISGTSTAYATLSLDNAHFGSTQTTTPTLGTPTNCGTNPTAAITVGSTDIAGSFTLTTGSGSTSTTCDTILTFDKTYSAAPKSIIVIGKTDTASVIRQIYVSSATATNFTTSFATSAGGANGTVYSFNYWVIE